MFDFDGGNLDAPGIGLTVNDFLIAALTEFNLGDLLGKDWSQPPYREQLAEVFRDPDNKRPGGESFNELSARVTAALRKLLAQHQDKKILLIAHGVANRTLLGYVRGLSTTDAYALLSQTNDEAFEVNWTEKIPAEVTSRRYG